MAEALPEYSDSDFSEDELTPLDISFNKAAEHLRAITSKLDNNKLLELYGLYKQGTEGKCNTPKPGWFDGTGRRKWEAWRALGDMTNTEAKQKYIDLLQNVDPGFKAVSLTSETGPKDTWVAVSSLKYSPEPELIHDELSLLEAARENCGERITKLLLQNPELVHETNDDGLTALHWAADRDATDALTALIDGKCPIDAVDELGQTALHYAAACGHVQSTQILLKAGATLIKDKDDCTPLDLVTDNEVRKLLESVQ